VVTQFHSVPSTLNFDGRDVKIHLTREARRRGVKIINRVMMTDLISSPEGHISGALGVGTRDGKIYAFKTKAVVTSTGRVNRISRSHTGVWGNTRLPAYETGDGRAMAFRAGLPIINMEFLSPSSFAIGNFELNLGAPRNTTQPAGSVVDGDGKVIVPRTYFYDWETLGKEKVDAAEALRKQLEAAPRKRPDYVSMKDQGRGPFYLDLTGGTPEEIAYIEWSISNEGKGSYFLDYLKNQEKFDFAKDKLEWLPNSREMAGTASSGLVVNKDLETGIKGLFAAGDEVGGLPWVCAPGAVTMGWHAGEMAAKEAMGQVSFPDLNPATLNALNDLCSGMLDNEKGLHWREVEMAIQNIIDFYAGNVRSEKMLLRGIDRLRDIKKNVSFRADNPHELTRCLEVVSVSENAEMVLRASLARRESRKVPFGFYRADFPETNDKDYFAFLGMRLKGEQVEFSKIDIKR
jgi:succinate dehydrogenase/fumarate reductase flavoprotein subunit